MFSCFSETLNELSCAGSRSLIYDLHHFWLSSNFTSTCRIGLPESFQYSQSSIKVFHFVHLLEMSLRVKLQLPSPRRRKPLLKILAYVLSSFHLQSLKIQSFKPTRLAKPNIVRLWLWHSKCLCICIDANFSSNVNCKVSYTFSFMIYR